MLNQYAILARTCEGHHAKEYYIVAKNGKPGGGRVGAVKDRSQTHNPTTGQWVKRDTGDGKFMDVKQDGTPFKGVRKENDHS